jgi:ribosomal RNA-processing protein 36
VVERRCESFALITFLLISLRSPLIADKKDVRVRARMDAIASAGGKRAVKKAIEKRQKKIGQKEKKSRPFAPPQRASGSQKRARDEEGPREAQGKRRRVNE